MNSILDHAPEWHDERRLGVGGSDAPKIMAGEWHLLWLLKTGREEPEDLSNVLQVQLGKFTEPFNIEWFERQTSIPVQRVGCDGLQHAKHHFMRANLDGFIPDHDAIFEAKHTSAFQTPEDVVSRYYPQLQHCIEIKGTRRAFLSVIFGNHKWAYFEIERDAAYIADLIEREREFWGYVERDEEPPGSVEGIATKIALDDMREVDMTGNNAWAQGAADWLDTREAAKRFKAAEKDIKGLVEDDVKLAEGHGIVVKRSKAGALTIKESK